MKTAYSPALTKPLSRKMTPFRMSSDRTSVAQCGEFSAGFSLVEVMVAMVIGLLGIIVMVQTFSFFEGQKRTTTGGDDAISSGAIALYGVQRDIQQSGWGLNALQLIGCTVRLPSQTAGSTIILVPVTINPAGITGDTDTDTVMVVSGNGNGTVEGDNIDAQPAVTNYAVHTPTSFAVGDQVVAVPQARPSPCNLTLTNVTAVASPNVTVTTGVAGMTAGRLYNLGSLPKVRVYAIHNGNLTVCDYWATDCAADTSAMTTAQLDALWVPIANNVVSMRAEYGRDTAVAGMDAIADRWDQTVATAATPVSTTAAKNTDACGLLRVSAVRLALVARSSQPEKVLAGGAHVTTAAPLWAGSDAAAAVIDATEAAAVAINLPDPNANWPKWQDFRYKVFQTVVPLRNITSMGVVEGC